MPDAAFVYVILQIRLDTLGRLERALEAAGVEFMPSGARLRDKPAEASG